MSIGSALSDFMNALMGIVISVSNSIFAVFHAVFALGADLVHGVFTIAHHLVAMMVDLFSGVLGFITANFVAIAVLVGGYFAYVQYQERNRGVVRNKT
ncbi:hypothetical protein BDN70DRAFT_877613 [Pholiota conissans]|uniref:Uncharacterized protein n=1 Tax=Pholiota conissans TaxID=109636 RepID=A0A9P5Z3J0_9AGAR|nr:hypothetical protein BDN70DRAFT_877613 [Pholiota conissans]